MCFLLRGVVGLIAFVLDACDCFLFWFDMLHFLCLFGFVRVVLDW